MYLVERRPPPRNWFDEGRDWSEPNGGSGLSPMTPVRALLMGTYYTTMWECDYKWACPPRCMTDRWAMFAPVHWVGWESDLSSTHLVGHAYLWCHKRHIFKMACDSFNMCYNMSPLRDLQDERKWAGLEETLGGGNLPTWAYWKLCTFLWYVMPTATPPFDLMVWTVNSLWLGP